MLARRRAGGRALWRAAGRGLFRREHVQPERDASKVALVWLVEALRSGGFSLLDTQFLTTHLAGFGALEIPRAQYLLLLGQALGRGAVWPQF